jgi:hypothetical protein
MIPGQLRTISWVFGGTTMEGHSILLRGKDREALRERWLQRAGTAFERMFGQANQEQLVTFTQREDLACALGKELATFLLEEHASVDVLVRPTEKRPPCCPKCAKPGQRMTKRNEKLPERELVTRAGTVTLRREQWHCSKCRILFFSVRPEATVGDGGIQSAAGGEGGAASGQGIVLPRSE